jgi:hypothetical protein
MRTDIATFENVRYVAERMRDEDLREFLALSTAHNRIELVEALVKAYGEHPAVFCVYDGDEPVAIGGLIQHRPNVGTVLFFATDRIAEPDIGMALTRFIKQRLLPRYRDNGMHRIEAVSIEGHTQAHRWIEAIGLPQEGPPMRGFGKGCETYIQFADVRPTGA